MDSSSGYRIDAEGRGAEGSCDASTRSTGSTAQDIRYTPSPHACSMEFTQFPHWPKQHARTHGAASQFTLPSLGARGSSGCRRLTGERAVARARERAMRCRAPAPGRTPAGRWFAFRPMQQGDHGGTLRAV